QLSEIKDIRINSPLSKDYSPYILNVSFRGVRAEVLLHLLEAEDIYVSTGSACSSKTSVVQGSYVMKALNISTKDTESAIRFSFSAENTKEEVDKTVAVLKKSLMFLRRGKR
ncbi:MAG: aminotransferase class V-fold PLP-dependent enzyme, partial [Clostridium sp.]